MPVTIAVFMQVLDARLAKVYLESHNIPCFLADENILSVQPFYASAIGGVKLNVHPEHEVEARRLYAEFQANSPGSEELEMPPCPACGSDAVLPMESPPEVYYNEYRCFDCDHEWDDRALHNLNPGHIE